MAKKRFESDALQHVYRRLVGDDANKQAEFEREYEDTLTQVDAAQLIYDMRTKAGRVLNRIGGF
jgi:hypothetical protein